MFNQPHPARAAVPWQLNAGIAKKLSSRGYATTLWTTDEPEAYADLGYPAKPGGFSADHYQPMRQPLTKQAQASLALLEGEYRNETLGEEKPESQPSTATNEHLPFVMDHFAATRKSKLRVNVDPSVLKRAMDHADLAETLQVSPITSDEKVADPIVIHPDVPDEAPLPEALPVLDDIAVPETQEAAPAVEPELPAVVGGIDPEEVAQREAEQFAKGLAQAREAHALALAQAVEAAKTQALAQGIEQGIEQGKAQGREESREEAKAEGLQQGLEQGREQGKAEGLSEGEQKARTELAEEMAAQRVLFENVSNALNDLLNDPTQFFEPLKRLSLHIAEQVMVGELQTSSQAIERLVQRCLDELDHPAQGAVVVELNPEDKVRLQTHSADFIKGMRLEAVHEMQPGSVRVFANDTVVEDLVEHRLEAMAHALHIDEKKWRAQSVLTNLEAEKEEEDDDVHS